MSDQPEMTTSSRSPARPTIGQVLLNAELIDKNDLQRALNLQSSGDDRRLGTILIEEGLIDADSLAMALSVHLNVPYIDLRRHHVQQEALELIPESTARRYSLIPLDLVDGTLAVVMEDPTDIQVIEELEAISGRSVTPMVGVTDDIRSAVDLRYKSNRAIEQEVATFAPPGQTGRLRTEAEQAAAAQAQDPVVRAVDLILKQSVRERASDIHIIPDQNKVRIRYRVDGILQDSLSLPIASLSPLISRIKIMAGMNIAERRRAQDGQFAQVINGEQTFFRVATSETTEGEMATLRVLGRSESIIDLTGLGLSEESVVLLRNLAHSPFGMMLVCGPTGSGKTTTLYAALNQLDRVRRNVMTIEDPVEYNFHRINQIQVNRAADITFAAGLRGIMRLDPDVVMVGEVRDSETAQAATQAAMTGHLVLTSLHANEASGALYRLDHLGVERYLLVSAAIGIVAQRLVRMICPHCRVTIALSQLEMRVYEREMGESLSQAYQGEGCTYCNNTGYLGRTGVFEILIVNDEIRQLVMQGASTNEIKAAALRNRMVTMRQDGMLKVRQGLTTAEEVIRNVSSLP